MQSGQHFSVKDTNLFKFHELEKKEIEKIRWLESEKEGSDIGEFRTNWVWWAYYRNSWVKGLRQSGIF